MNIIVGGIKGLASTISFKKKEPKSELREKFRVPEHDLCVHDFNCALQDSILLQGNLYIYNTMVCFHSVFNKNSIVGNEGTSISIPYSQLVLVEKKKKLLFDNSIQLTTVNRSYFFTSFLSRNKAIEIISEYLELYHRMLPKPSQALESNIHLSQSDLNQIDNEDEWLKQALLQIQNLEKSVDQQNINYNQQQNQDNNINHMIQSRLRDQSQNNLIQNYNNSIPIQNIQIKQSIQPNNLPQFYNQFQNEINNPQQNNQQPYQSRLYQLNVEEQNVNNSQLQINNNNNNNNDLEEEIQPLQLQKSVIKEFEDHAAIYKPLFDERSNNMKTKITKDFASANLQEISIKDMSAREFFGIFFSNQMYKCERLNKVYNCFFEFYISEYLHGSNLSISEIQPPPPEIFNSIYSSNYLQLLEYAEYSERHISFVHPIPKPSALLPKSLQCQMREHIYWQSPQSFILIRYLTLKGMPMCSSFEPRVIYYVDEIDGHLTLRSGFYVHFKSSSFFKKLIEKSSKEENEKTWNELKNLLQNVSEDYKKKRDENKLILQQENQQFLKEFNANEFEQYDGDEEEEIEQNINPIPQSQSNKQNNVQPQQQNQLQQQQQQVNYEQEISRVAAQASNQACSIF